MKICSYLAISHLVHLHICCGIGTPNIQKKILRRLAHFVVGVAVVRHVCMGMDR